MAARQASQSNAMLYALITFIALFIISAVIAVVYYVKSEEYRTQAQLAREDLTALATPSENGSLARIVGKPSQGKSYLGTMQEVVDDLYSFILGQQPLENLSATAKFNEISIEIDSLNKSVLGKDYANPGTGPNSVALLKTIVDLKSKLDNAHEEIIGLNKINDDLHIGLEDATANIEQERQNYEDELNLFKEDLDSIQNRFEQLQAQMQESTEEQLQAFQDKLDVQKDKLRQKELHLKETEEKLSETDTLLQDALTKLETIKPDPNREMQAYEPDAQIIRIDLQNGIVYLDIGIKDHVYRGLTFAIYDRNKPIPENGNGKAEIEVFQVTDQVSAARIVKSDTNDPVVKTDIVANLIWDRDVANRLVVAGEFDYNKDGRIDTDGTQRIAELIERWGGVVVDSVTVDTDFIIIGSEPITLRRPTQDEMDIDPMAQQRYEISVKKAQAYNELLEKADSLGIPVFNQNRFMYLIGYNTLMHKNPML